MKGGVDAVNVNALVDLVAQIEVVVKGAADKCKGASGIDIDIDVDVALKVVVDLIVVRLTLHYIIFIYLSLSRIFVLPSRLLLMSVPPLTSAPFWMWL